MRKYKRASILLFAGAGLLLLVAGNAMGATIEDEVAHRIICQCGCGKVLAICEMEGWAVPAKALIARKAAQGISADEIVQYFVDQYGEKILAAPPKSGFFLTVWVAPFAMLILGGGLIIGLIRHWVGSGGGSGSVPSTGPLTPQQEALVARFEAEVREET